MTRDEGLQAERTLMAWGRTLIALIGTGLLLLRWLPTHGYTVLLVVSVNVGVAATIWLTQKRRYLRLLNTMEGRSSYTSLGTVLGLAAMSLLIGMGVSIHLYL